MKTVSAPFASLSEPELPERFLPGDGRTSPGRAARLRAPLIPSGDPVIVVPLAEPRETLREAEERLAQIHEEDTVLEQRKKDLVDFRKDAESFKNELGRTLDRLRQLEHDMAQEEAGSRRAAQMIGKTMEGLEHHVERAQRIHPEDWSKTRMQAELDRAADRLAEVEADARGEMEGLKRSLPDRLKVRRPGWAARLGYGLSSGFAFLLPLIAFALVAAILVMTALGLL